MKTRTVACLTILVCIVAVFIAVVEQPRESTQERMERDRRVLRVIPGRVTALFVETEKFALELSRERDGWFLRQPLRARANEEKIERVLTILEELPCKERITAQERAERGLTLEDYGLLKPRVRIGFGETAGRRSILIGVRSPLGDSLYVRLEGSESVVVTAPDVLAAIPDSVEEWRDRTILRGPPVSVDRLEIKRADALIRLARVEGEWRIQHPVVGRAQRAKVARLLEALFALRVCQFVPDLMRHTHPLSEGQAAVEVTLWRHGEERGKKILIGRAVEEPGREEVYARRGESDSLFTVDRAVLDALGVSVDALRDRALLPVAPEYVAFVRLAQGEHNLELRKKEGPQWFITEPGQWKAERGAVDHFLRDLTAFGVEQFIDEPGTNLALYGLDPPGQVVQLAEDSPASAGVQPKTLLLRVGGDVLDRKRVYANIEGQPAVLEVAAGLRDRVSVDPLRFRDRTVLSLAGASVRRISLQREGIEQTVERTESADWRPVSPAEGTVASNVVGELLARVESLRAVRFERSAGEEPAAFGVADGGRLSVTFGLSGAEGIQKTLVVGTPTDGGCHATIRGLDVIFVLSGEVAESLNRDIVLKP
ncbi:MAG: DUF4340 domain-containing protein [Kiritimatiellae bacterium]|nr:DUF4340 domain-containing protein [Kiritimatiellia bacterium]